MKQGDFTALAKDYINRPGYSEMALRIILNFVEASTPRFITPLR